MSDSARFKLMVALFLIMISSSAVFMYLQSAAIQSAIDGSAESPPTADQAREEAAEVEKHWKAATAAMKGHDHAKAREHLGQASPFEFTVSQFRESERQPGLTFDAWWKQQTTAFDKAVMSEFAQVTRDSLAQPGKSHQFVDFFVSFKDQVPELLKAYEEKKPEIEAARMKAAGRWFRLSVTGEGEPYRQALEQRLKDRWQPLHGRELFTGPAMSDGEGASTWMHLEARVDTEGASYELKSRYGNRTLQVKVPVLLTVSFKLHKRLPVPTSWDSLTTIICQEETPASIVGSEYEIHDKVSEQARHNEKQLEAQLKTALGSLPSFQLFPGIDPKKLSLMKEGMVDRKQALIIGLSDPQRLEREVRALSASASGALLRDLVSTAIEQDLDALGPWVMEYLGQASAEDRQAAQTHLLKNAGYADFGPLLTLASLSEGDNLLPIFETLGRFLFHQGVYHAFLSTLGKRSGSQRARIASIFLQGIPEKRLRQQFALARDPDPEVARIALEVINRRLPDAGTELAIALFPMASAAEKRTLLWNLKQKHTKLPASSVGILRQAARDSDTGIREDALEILCDQAYQSVEAWQALNEVKASVTDPSWQERIGRQLADSVKKSNPAMAKQFVFSAIRGLSANDRRAAAHKVFRLDLPPDDLLPEVASLVTTYGSDGTFFEAVLRSLSEQGMSKLKNVDSAELEQILKKAVDHSDKMVKYFGYSLMYSAWSKGAKKYAEPLKFGLARESDKWLKGQIKNKVDAIQRSENPEGSSDDE